MKLKFKENDDKYYSLIVGEKSLTMFDRDGKNLGEISLEIMRDTLLNYCTIIREFPWEENILSFKRE